MMLAGAGNVELMLTLTQVAVEVMLQAFVAVTHMVPFVLPDVTVMVAVPCPEAIVQPVGTVHVYEEAPGTVAAV
jgi:hypothetical protein